MRCKNCFALMPGPSPQVLVAITYDFCMASAGSRSQVVSFKEARHIVEDHAARVLQQVCEASATESVELLTARGRVLAEAIVADRDFPPFFRATRDGYAVRARDVERVPAQLTVVGEIKAGDSPDVSRKSITLERGQAVSIMTGAPLPAGADAIVMVEYTKAAGDKVEIARSLKSGENFVPRGAEALAGQTLVDQGHRLDHSLIALAASVGKAHVEVFRRPRVAVLATGNEVVEINASPGPAQIRNSNTYSLAAQIQEAGAEAVLLPIAPDQPQRLRELIKDGMKSDLLLITGGVSMGKYDLVEQALSELNAEFYFTGAQIQPGKPIVFGSCAAGTRGTGTRGTGAGGADIPVRKSYSPAADPQRMVSARSYFFGLPGNPVSTMVTFRLFVQPMIAALAGARHEPLVFLKAKLKSEVRTKTGLTRFLPAVLSGELENAEVELAAWQGSGDIAALARANCYLVIPPDRERIDAGEWVSVLTR